MKDIKYAWFDINNNEDAKAARLTMRNQFELGWTIHYTSQIQTVSADNRPVTRIYHVLVRDEVKPLEGEEVKAKAGRSKKDA